MWFGPFFVGFRRTAGVMVAACGTLKDSVVGCHVLPDVEVIVADVCLDFVFISFLLTNCPLLGVA